MPPPPQIRRRPHRLLQAATPTQTPRPLFPSSWEDRCRTLAAPGHIRLLDPPTGSLAMQRWWDRDMTLTEWVHALKGLEADASANPIQYAFLPADYADRARAIFKTTQRQRWLARIVLQRLQQRVWRRRTQCNVDMILNDPVPDQDAIFLTDTTHRQVYRFHRRDVYNSLLSNICQCDEMLPSPRQPTNPWTNAPLTFAQTIGTCQQLAADYGRRSRCPPPLFAAFWAARFDLRRFQQENAPALARHAIAVYFKDLHDDNRETVCDTLFQLLSDAQCDYSPTAIRRWLRQSPQTALHREWLELARDYTLYVNLHVQVRSHWNTTTAIHRDVRALYSRTTLPDAASSRIRILRGAATGGPPPQLLLPALQLPAALPTGPLPGLGLGPSTLFDMVFQQQQQPPLPLPTDLSGGEEMTADLALQLIQAALFRM